MFSGDVVGSKEEMNRLSRPSHTSHPHRLVQSAAAAARAFAGARIDGVQSQLCAPTVSKFNYEPRRPATEPEPSATAPTWPDAGRDGRGRADGPTTAMTKETRISLIEMEASYRRRSWASRHQILDRRLKDTATGAI